MLGVIVLAGVCGKLMVGRKISRQNIEGEQDWLLNKGAGLKIIVVTD
jgi:hypothetical protein